MSHQMGDRTPSPSKRRSLKFWILTAAAVSVILGILISVLLPLGIQWGMKKALSELGAESVVIENIDFNAFIGRLVIFGLEFNGPEEGSLNVDRIIVDLDLIPVWKKRIMARDISVIGLDLDVIQPENGDLVIGGFPLTRPVRHKETLEGEKRTGKQWGVGMSSLDLDDINVRLSAFGVKEVITLDRAHLSDFHAWDPGKTGQLDISFMFNGGLVQIMGEAKPFTDRPTVTAELRIGEMPLDWMIPYLTSEEVRREVGKKPLRRLFPKLQEYDLRTIDGEFWARSKLNIQYDPWTGNRTVSLKSSLTLKDLDVTGSLASIPIRYRERQFVIDSSFDYWDEGTVNPDNIRVTAASTIEEMRLDSMESGRNILSVDLYRLTGLTETGTDLAEAERVYFEGVKVLEGDSGSHAVNAKEIALNDIRFSDLNRIEVAEIDVKGVETLVALDSQGNINLIQSMKEILPETKAELEEKPEESVAGSSPVTIKIEKISVSDGSKIRIHDASVTPSVEMALNPLEIELTDLDSAKPGNPSFVTLTSKFGKYSDLDVHGTIKPFASKPTMDLKVTVRSLDLPPLTSYSKKNIGHLIKSGQLDADVDWRVDQGNLDSQVNLLLHKFRLEAIDESDEEAFSERLDIPIPVNMALSLLQDKNDNIDLKLPISGNIEDPEFQLRNVVYKAVGKAMTSGVVGYFAPLGLNLIFNVVLPPGTITLAGALAGSATKLRFDPVQFSPLEFHLNAEQGKYLDRVAQLIQDRPGVELVLCGIASPEDLAALRRRATEEKVAGIIREEGTEGEEGAPPENSLMAKLSRQGLAVPKTIPVTDEEAPITPDERADLQTVAKERALSVKEYLIGKGVGPGRLLICFSEFEDKEDALPRVEIAL